MPKSQGSPKTPRKPPPKRDNKNPKARRKLNSVQCLWSYLEGIAKKRWERPITKLNKIYNKLYKPLVSLMVAFLLSFVIFIIMIFFPKLTEMMSTTLITLIIILVKILFIIFVITVIILAIPIIIEDALYYIIIPIFGLRGLVRILPALIDELKGKLPKDVEEDAQEYIENKKYRCMKRFKGNATEALSRINQSTFFLMLINLILSSFLILLVVIFLIIGPILVILHLLLGLKIPSISILITGIKSAITKTVVEIVLWVLGVALSIIIGLSLFSSQAKFDANTLHFVYDVKFTVLEWFVFAVFLIIISLIIISVKVPPIIAIIITVPAIITFIALIISIIVYIILASATIDYMQLARNNQGEN